MGYSHTSDVAKFKFFFAKKRFTWSQRQPPVKCRLDYFLIPQATAVAEVCEFVKSTMITPWHKVCPYMCARCLYARSVIDWRGAAGPCRQLQHRKTAKLLDKS